METELLTYFDKCRCCFSSIGKRKKNSLQIDKTIENRFFNLSNIELKSSSFLSNKICEECINKLSSFCNFKKELVEKQEKLYELLGKMKRVEPRAEDSTDSQENDPRIKLEPQTEPEIQIMEIKQEPGTSFAVKKTVPKMEESREKLINAQENLPVLDPLNIKNEPILEPEIQIFEIKQEPVEMDFAVTYEENLERSDFEANPHTVPQKLSWTLEEPEFFDSEDDRKKKRVSKALRRINTSELACDLCPYRNNCKKYMRNHILTHLPKESRLLKCKLCSKMLISRSSLSIHMRRMHSDWRPFKCSSCGKGFALNSELNGHIQAKHSGRNFVCDQCGKSFGNQDGLRSHTKNMHPTEPRGEFPCDKCDKIFQSNSNLRRHMALHEAPTLKCNFCVKMFHFSSQKREHEESSHLGVTYSCKLCPRTYQTPYGLKKHLIKRHGKK